MGYSAEVVQRARARLAQAKEDRESENRQHLAEAYAKVPRIREIDMLLRRTMAQAAQAAFLQGSDGQALLEQARQENLGLQRERAALAAANFEEGFLDESPICDKCGGRVKPDVVLYEESLPEDTLTRSVNAIANADLLLVGGTSLTVYPAAGLLRYFRGEHLVLLNRDATPMDEQADLCIREPIGKVLEQIQVRDQV